MSIFKIGVPKQPIIGAKISKNDNRQNPTAAASDTGRTQGHNHVKSGQTRRTRQKHHPNRGFGVFGAWGLSFQYTRKPRIILWEATTAKIQKILIFNPFYHFIVLFRDPLMNNFEKFYQSFFISVLMIIIVFLINLKINKHLEKKTILYL